MGLKKIGAHCLILTSISWSLSPALLPDGWAGPDRAEGTFEELRLMEEKAASEKDTRAVSVILYVRRTPAGQLFSVDTESKNIEVVVTLTDKSKLPKPLEQRRDQNLLVEYHRKVKDYSLEYGRVVGELKQAGFRVEDAPRRLDNFATLAKKYPGFSSALRAQGVILLKLGRKDRAVEALSNAIQTNPEDVTAHALLGIAYLADNKVELAAREKNFVQRLDSQNEHLATWEIKVVEVNQPEVWNMWLKPRL